MTFFLEIYSENGWERASNKSHTSSEYAKSELKKLYDAGKIETPVPGRVRVVADGSTYFVYDYRDKGLRFRWRQT